VTWTGPGRTEERQAYHAHEGGLCRPRLCPALREAPVETADWLAVIGTGTEKRDHVRTLGPRQVVAGVPPPTTRARCKEAALGIAVLGPVGLCADTLRTSDVVVADPCAGLNLLLHPARLVATLRR
jgi:hypothetical protein